MKASTRSFYEQAVQRAVDRVTSNLDDALDLESLAREAGLSPFHFHRIFRGMLGETPLEMHRRLRLERAAHALTTQDVSVTRVAFDAGYDTHEAFTRAFRNRFDLAPSELRRRSPPDGCTRPFDFHLVARSGVHFTPHPPAVTAIQFIRGEPGMNIQIKDMPPFRVACVRHVGPYNQISEAFARLGQVANDTPLCGPETMMLGIYHDDPETTPAAALRSDAGLTVGEAAALPDGLTEQRLPAGRYACATHIGPYTELGDAWARLMGQWLPESGERVGDGLPYEIYRNTPMDTPPHELHTELYVPLAT